MIIKFKEIDKLLNEKVKLIQSIKNDAYPLFEYNNCNEDNFMLDYNIFWKKLNKIFT